MSTPAKRLTNLQMYVQVLEAAATDGLPSLAEMAGKHDDRLRATRELLDAGFLSDSRVAAGPVSFVEHMVLTPDGAMAMLQWKDYLEKRSLRARLVTIAGQVALVLVGAAASGVASLFGGG